MSEIVTVARSPEMIAGEINAIKAQTRQVMLSAALEIGKKLIEAKSLVPHGRWTEWLEANVDYSDRKAQDLMHLYEEYGKNGLPPAIAGLDYTKAVALLALPDELREETAQKALDEDMSVRELQAEIASLRAELDARQMRIDDFLRQARDEEQLLSRAEEAEAAADKLRAEAKKAKETAAKDKQRAADAVARANATAGENTALKARVAELEAAPPQVVEKTVEAIPEETRAELDALRAQVRAAPNEQVVRLRAGYERLLQEFRAVEALLDEVRAADPAEAEKYQAALFKACVKMSEHFGGEGE